MTAQEENRQDVQQQTMVVYDLVTTDFETHNLYAVGGLRPNARWIAQEHGCQLQIRWSKYRQQIGKRRFFPSYLERQGIAHDGSCRSALLVGKNRKQLAKARDDIHRTLGVAPFDAGSIDIGDEETVVFSRRD